MRTRRRKSEAGQSIVLVTLGLSIFMLGGLGFAIDGSHLYAQRQLAQAAADAAAQAAMLSIFNGTNTSGTYQFADASGTTYNCTASDNRTPCYYAQTMNGFNGSGDTVTYTPNPPGLTIPKLSGSDPVNLLQVTVTRQVNTTFMGMLGTAFSTIGATGTAAIVDVTSPVPIIVTHPTLANALELKGKGSTWKIEICGGPQKSIQVNSSDGASIYDNGGGGEVNLSHGGPSDTSSNCTGNGSDFGAHGGPASASGILVTPWGSSEHFQQPASVIDDPMSGVSAPSAPSITNPGTGTLSAGSNGCPTTATGGCTLYFPGEYTSDIKVMNANAVFAPGIYYMYGANFTAAANGNMYYATGLTDSNSTGTPSISNCCGTGTGWGGGTNGGNSNAGVLVYMTGPSSASGDTTGTINISSNSNVLLVGSPASSNYQGMLFFVDRSAAYAEHNLDGGGGLTLYGTIYMPELLSVMNSTPTQYQLLHFQGNAGSSTLLYGEIITSALLLEGTPGITMTLSTTAIVPVRQIALVN